MSTILLFINNERMLFIPIDIFYGKTHVFSE